MKALRHQLFCCVAGLAINTTLFAASPTQATRTTPLAEEVEFFVAMESGDIEATMIMSDATKGILMVKNRTTKPLTIKTPAALAGVPILAQRNGAGGIGGMGGGRNGGMGGMGGMQGMMGGMMGGGMMGGMGMGGMGMGGMGMGGMFNIAPDKVQKVRLVAVCADHGLTDPSPRVPYKPIRAETYAKDSVVLGIVTLMCAGVLDQPAAQAAVWHLQNGLSWDELAQKIGIKHINGTTEPFFTQDQLQRAIAATLVAQRLTPASPGESTRSLYRAAEK